MWRWNSRFGRHAVLSLPALICFLLAQPNSRADGRTRDPAAPEAPAGFDGLTNGHISQTQFDLDVEIFIEQEEIDEGLGPLFNSRACGECHANPVAGGISQITERRAGRLVNNRFTDHPGGSLINERAIHPAIQERVFAADTVRAMRTSLNVLGDGFVEAIADSTLEGIAGAQPSSMRGTIVLVPVLEAGGVLRAGRFGWKNQHASLISFSADAYLNEMGITSPLAPVENTSNGGSVANYDDVPDPEEAPTPAAPVGPDIEAFARFMRATKVPPRDLVLAASTSARAGERVFLDLKCSTCHTPTIVTARAGTSINGGKLVVSAALGNKTIHPYSDFLLHDVGTGDGIVQNGGASTRSQMRTPPLWGVRTRTGLMHDGTSLTLTDAILRHQGQAASVIDRFKRLSSADRDKLIAFLDSL